MAKFGFGQSVKRVEDARLIKGEGHYTTDTQVPGQLVGYVMRAPVAHAKITSLDVSAAQSAPGVLMVLTGEELAAAGANNLPCLVPIKNHDGTDRSDPGRQILATDIVRHVGDQIAFVVAETMDQAKDASDLISVEFDSRPAVSDMVKALEPGAPKVHESTNSNLCFDWVYGDAGVTDQAFAKAAKTVKIDLINNKVIANSMEPRACVCEWDAGEGKLTMHCGTQGGWMFQDMLAEQVSEPAQGQGSGRHAGCRRRLRHEGLLLHRICDGRVCGAQDQPPGRLVLRTRRGLSVRRHGPRPHHDRRVGVRCRQQGPGDARHRARRHGRVPFDVRAVHSRPTPH